MSYLQVGQDWAGSIGAIRVTREGQGRAFRNVGTLVDVPVDERRIKTHVVGSDVAEAAFAWHGSSALYDLMSLQSSRTPVPWCRWPRPPLPGSATPVGAPALSLMARIPSIESAQEPDAVTVRTIESAADGAVRLHLPGVIYDWEASAPAGVSAAVNGAWVAVGALVGGESYDLFALNLHDPAPTTSDTDWRFQSRTTGVTLDAAPAVDKGGGLVGLPSTAHGLSAGNLVELSDTVNYDGEYTLDASTSANELVIPATYQAETFAGTEAVGLITLVANLVAASTTPSVQKVTVDGAWAPTDVRLQIDNPADNLFYPVALITARPTYGT